MTLGPKISVITITLNEEMNIRKCLESVKWADEIIVTDTGSIDNTLNIVKEYTNRIYNYKFNDDFSKLRNFALKKVRYEWILSIDGDEVIPYSTQNKIREYVNNYNIDGYWFPRRQFINDHQYLKYGYFFPDYQLRLFKKLNYKYIGKVHEQLNIPMNKTKIINSIQIYHNSSRSKYSSLFSIKRYSKYIQIEAKEIAINSQTKISYFLAIVLLVKHFYRSFIKLSGYKDGYIGFKAALIHAIYRSMVILRAININNKK